MNKTETVCGDYHITSTVKDDYWMDFEIVEQSNGQPEIVCTGFIKWDGCQQVYFPGEPTFTALHFDDDGDITAFAAALLKVREIASEQLPAWDS